jgi:hypothetical protein
MVAPVMQRQHAAILDRRSVRIERGSRKAPLTPL